MPCNAGAQNWQSPLRKFQRRESQECDTDNVATIVVWTGNHYDVTMRCQPSTENTVK